jgi:hypothetical protein
MIMSQIRSLSGEWAFEADPRAEFTVETLALTRAIPVPLPWQAAFPDLERYGGYAWYRRTFDLDDSWLAGEVLLTFGAVDYACDVYVNGQHAGGHEGGYTPFTLPVRRWLRAGDNELTVRVYDPIQLGIGLQRYPEFPLEAPSAEPPGPQSVPHGKQEWYINVGGLWQDVTLRAVPATWIDGVRVTTALDGTAQIEVSLAGERSPVEVSVTALWDGATVAAASASVTGSGSFTLHIDEPRWWSPDDPHLYTLHVRAGADTRELRFGIRTIETRDGYLLLNGEPLYLLAALDQDFYRETIYTPPSDDFLRDQFRKAKELGLNCLRCHIKVPDPRYLDLADEIGLLVWQEIPSWRTFYPKGEYHDQQDHLDEHIRARVETTLRDMIARDFNHPSIIIWTMVNEDWGTMLPLSAADRAWVRSLYHLAKQLDSTRLVVDNSPCPAPWGPNIHVQSDLDDWHTYANIPDAAQVFTQVVEQLNMRALWTYSSHGDSQRTGDEPVIVSEFGNWGLASVAPYLGDDGSEPQWFGIGPWWSGWDGEPGWMSGVLGRFERLGLARIFGDYDAFATATQWHQYQALKFEIEAMRRLPALMGYVITEFTDCYWEGNGLLDFDRRPKAYHAALRQFNAEDVLVAELRQQALWAGETLEMRLHASHFSKQDWDGAQIHVAVGEETTEAALEAAPRGQVLLAATQRWTMPAVQQATVQTIDLRLRGRDGAELAHNTTSVLVLPESARGAAYRGPVAVVNQQNGWDDRRDALELALRNVGYASGTALDGAKLAVSAAPTPELLAWVRDGGDLLFLCQGASPFFWAHGRGGTYSGNWMTCWSWIDPAVHQRLAHPQLNPLKLPFVHVMPRFTITGLPVEEAEYQPDFLAGQVSGWVNHPAIHTVRFRYGAGRVLMTTFALAEGIGVEPVGTAMLHDLVDHLASEACQPRLQANW